MELRFVCLHIVIMKSRDFIISITLFVTDARGAEPSFVTVIERAGVRDEIDLTD